MAIAQSPWPPGYPKGGSYADLLLWHLFVWGTRAGGSTRSRADHVWEEAKFITEVFKGMNTTRPDKPYRSWTGNGRCSAPDNRYAPKVAKALFNGEVQFATWAAELEEARTQCLGEGRNLASLNVAAAISAAVEYSAYNLMAGEVEANDEAYRLRLLGDICARKADNETAISHYIAAVAIYQKNDNHDGQSYCFWRIYALAPTILDVREAHPFLLDALAYFRKTGDVHREGHCLHAIGEVTAGVGDYASARASLRLGLEVCRRAPCVRGEANCLKILGDVEAKLENYDVANGRYLEAMVLYQNLNDLQGQAITYHSLGNLEHIQSNRGEALAHFESAVDFYHRCNNHKQQMVLLKWIADLPEL